MPGALPMTKCARQKPCPRRRVESFRLGESHDVGPNPRHHPRRPRIRTGPELNASSPHLATGYVAARTLKLSDRLKEDDAEMKLWRHGRFGAVPCSGPAGQKEWWNITRTRGALPMTKCAREKACPRRRVESFRLGESHDVGPNPRHQFRIGCDRRWPDSLRPRRASPPHPATGYVAART